jgi:NAD+ kinase
MSAFAVIYNRKPTIRRSAEAIIVQLKKNGYKLVSPSSREARFLLTLGGDGTVLHSINNDRYHNLPILSVRLGKIGFLSEISPDKVIWGIEKVLTGKFTIDRRLLLQAATYRNGKMVASGYALNEVVIHSARLARIVNVDVRIKGKKTTSYRADGIIVSSATGSTAYNLSAGGPVLPPERQELIVTPICPHLLKWSSQLVKPGQEVTLKIDFRPGQCMVVTFDGQEHFPVRAHDETKVKLSSKKVDFIRFKPYNFQKILKEKLS